jgi:hypothetical protein
MGAVQPVIDYRAAVKEAPSTIQLGPGADFARHEDVECITVYFGDIATPDRSIAVN